MRHLQTFRLHRGGRARRLDAQGGRGHEHHRIGAEPAHQPVRGGVRRRTVRALAQRRAAQPGRELLLHHYRATHLTYARVQGQVADLSGERRGHVSIACSQALLPYFLPREIARYRADHPGVTFSVNVRDRAQAEQELASYSSDLALVFEPVYLVDFQVIEAIPQAVNVVMRADHPLARKPELRLRDCLDAPHVAPSVKYGVRHLLDFAARRGSRRVSPLVETESFELIRHYVLHENVIGFQIPIGLHGFGDPLAGFPADLRTRPATRQSHPRTNARPHAPRCLRTLRDAGSIGPEAISKLSIWNERTTVTAGPGT